MSKLRGGSAGERSRSYACPFFHRGVDAVVLKRDTQYTFRLLPAFNENLRDTPGFRLSTLPYRELDAPTDGSDAGFTSWYFTATCHRYVGPSEWSAVSPLSLEEDGSGYGVDPLLDLYRTAKNSANPQIKFLTDKPKDSKDSAILQAPKDMAFLNAIMWNEQQQPQVKAIVISNGSLKVTKEALNTARPAKIQQIIDPNFPDYLYGDVTSLLHGCLVTARKGPTSDGGFDSSVMYFSEVPGQLTGYRAYPLDPNNDWTKQFLNLRYDFADQANVTKVMDAQEMVNRIVEDNFLPYDLVVSVCSRHWNVPPEKVRATHFPGAGHAGTAGVPVTHGALGQAPSPHGAPMLGQAPAPVPPPAPVAPAAVFYMAGPNNVPVQVTAEDIITRLTTEGDTFPVYRQGDANWTSPTLLGFTPRRATLPTPPPAMAAAPVPPPPPAAPAPAPAPMAPAAPAMPAAPGGVTGYTAPGYPSQQPGFAPAPPAPPAAPGQHSGFAPAPPAANPPGVPAAPGYAAPAPIAPPAAPSGLPPAPGSTLNQPGMVPPAPPQGPPLGVPPGPPAAPGGYAGVPTAPMPSAPPSVNANVPPASPAVAGGSPALSQAETARLQELYLKMSQTPGQMTHQDMTELTALSTRNSAAMSPSK